ncbi:MAG: ArsA family ATPase [Actinomycetota bacterium]|nr:ArsA family ATPase [Actinomycetota bacterium]
MPDLLDKRLLFVAGKGGVGRTTVAASLGLLAARRGKRTIVVEVARQERVSRSFEHAGAGYRETELAPNLYGISIDPDKSLEEYLVDQVGSRRLAGLLLHNRIFEYLAAATPGLRELVTIGKVWELALLERRRRGDAPYDLVILDGPPTGQGLGMLRTPQTFADVARVGPIRRKALIIDEFLRDPARTGVVAVALPEDMPVNETLEFGQRLREQMGYDPQVLVMNALLPERFTREECEAIERVDGDAGEPTVAAALRAALSEHHRCRGQRSELRRLRKEAGDTPVITLPFLFENDTGLDEWERLSRELESKL